MSAVHLASQRRHLRLSSVLFLILGFHAGAWAVQLGSLSAALHLDPGELGSALSGAAAGGTVTLFLGGHIADRFGRRIVLLLGCGVTSLAFAALAAARNCPEVLAAVILYGLAISFVDLGAAVGMTAALLSTSTWGSIVGMLVVGFAISPVVPTALSLAGRSAPDQAGQAVAFTTAVGYSSFLLSPIVVGTIATAAGLRAGLAVVVATALGIALLGLRWPRSDRPLGLQAASAD